MNADGRHTRPCSKNYMAASSRWLAEQVISLALQVSVSLYLLSVRLLEKGHRKVRLGYQCIRHQDVDLSWEDFGNVEQLASIAAKSLTPPPRHNRVFMLLPRSDTCT